MTAIDATAGAPPAAAQAPSGRLARFVGDGRAYWRILVRGAFLLIVTLGIYRFWLSTDMRRFLWGNTEIGDDGLEYVGTARELLIGFLIAVVLLVPLYTVFFVLALDLGTIGKISSIVGFVLLALLGQFAGYRARRYRLTRTVFRGLRFRQTGSAWRYAVCALFWWGMIIVTLGLAYPFAQASLERYKMRNTYYGDLGAYFVGSGWRLFFRGLLMWLLVIGPILVGAAATLGSVDWDATIEAVGDGTGDVMTRIESANPGLTESVTFTLIAIGWAIVMAALLYPAFQAMTLRWWTSGLRFGPITLTSRLRTRQVYGVYVRFVWYALLFAIVGGLVVVAGAFVVGYLTEAMPQSKAAEAAGTAILVAGYVLVALAYSTIYQATVKLRLWNLGFESIEFSDLSVLNNVKAVGGPTSYFGEGLANALHVGGI